MTLQQLMLGIPLTKLGRRLRKGWAVRSVHIALISGLGAILGKLLVDGGGATELQTR